MTTWEETADDTSLGAAGATEKGRCVRWDVTAYFRVNTRTDMTKSTLLGASPPRGGLHSMTIGGA